LKNLARLVRRPIRRRDEGATAVEYGLLIALIAVVIAAAAALLGTALSSRVHDACTSVANGQPGVNCDPPAGP
jgi:pilus assembly protein Flp/PilA